MTRLRQTGEPIRVGVDSLGNPYWLEWLGRWHPVEGVIRRWRVDEEWWHERIWREYFLLVTGSGLLVVIYHDLVAHEWRLQSVYD